jgi:two-component system sensor histidine kinase RpfC
MLMPVESGREKMQPRSHTKLLEHVRTQARLRARLGVPVCLLMLLCLWHWGPSSPNVGPIHIVPVFALHLVYNLGLLHVTRSASRCDPRHVATFTAVMDPVLLSAGLMLMNQIGQIFACFYLFTILGFGFRIGIAAMHVCQLASIGAFSLMALLNPSWHAYPVAVISILLFLGIVPLYAKALITRLQFARRHAESESQAKTRLLATVSHELRTPLTGIVSCAQLMQEESVDPQVRKRADTVLTLSAELLVQINDLLDSAKYGADTLGLAHQSFSMADVAEHLRCTLGPIALAKGIALRIKVDERMPALFMGDMPMLCRALMNLGGNAVKFTDEGEVNISFTLLGYRPGACHILCSCQDTGIGIDTAMHQKIFEPFFQASGGANRKYGGTGLGMSIARDIVSRMGGEIHVSSMPGQGSLFEFAIWLDKANTADSGIHKAGPTGIVRNKRILLADDNATNLMLTCALLERDGHRVLTASSGQEAVRLLSSTEIDLALLDFNMGDIDGATALQIYRFGKVSPAPAYILTADNSSATTRRLIDSGAAGVLHKPISLEALRRAISQQFCADAACATTSEENPIDWIDNTVIANLKELGSNDDFVARVVNTALADIRLLSNDLTAALKKQDLPSVLDKAHAIKGIAVSVGAVRLAALAARMSQMEQPGIEQDRLALITEIAEVTMQSMQALRGVVQSAAN